MSRLLIALPLFAAIALAVPPEEAKKKPPAKGSPEEALAQVQVEKGLKVEVWAAEPLLANAVSFAFDEKGRCFVAETERAGSPRGVPDTRNHMYWLDDDLASRTVADRLAMYKREYPGKKPYTGFEKYSDQLRLVWDSTGSGKADKSTVFSGGYNRPEDGIAAGVLARKGNVYFTCIPDLYLLKDTKGTGRADVKESLSSGYGVRVQFYGHDLHGLRMGPDGKLYFTCGDRGLHVVTKDGRTVSNPDSGAVLRCDPDGKNLEIVHTGLRNPQELAFDDYGNLFTFDNNSDSGDKARWVYVVEGGDSGWRAGYQYGTLYHPPGVPEGNRGPFNAEKIWHLPGKDGGPPAYVVPPLAHIGNGPAGITHYPGVGLGDRYKDHFFACDFTSSATNSKIWSLAVKPKGAGFEVADLHPFVQGMVPTDCEFGPDGAFYWSDWVTGWSPTDKGRIFRLTDPAAMTNPAVAEAKKLLAEGMEKRSVDELLKLLGHPHQQVRQEAQFELVAKDATEKVLPIRDMIVTVANNSTNPVTRRHAIWALGSIAKSHASGSSLIPRIASLGTDPDVEVRAYVAKELGEVIRLAGDNDTPVNLGARTLVRKLMADPEPRVRYFATIAYGRIGLRPALTTPGAEQDYYAPFFELLKSNNDTDPYLRHAAVVGLEKAAQNPADLWNVWTQVKDKYDTPAVRLGVVLALRRGKSEKCGEFLADPEPRVAAEAARAVHDERIEAAYPRLAALADSPGLQDAVAYRALSTGYKLGTPDAAARVAKFAARTGEPDHTRVFALKLLADWANPPRRDPVTGLVHDLPKRPADVAANALKAAGVALFTGSDAVRREAAQTVAKLGVKEFGAPLIALVKDPKAPVGTRAEALVALDALKDPAVKELVAFARASDQPALRAAGRAAWAKTSPADALKEVEALLNDETAPLVEKQGAFAILAAVRQPEFVSDRILMQWVDAVLKGTVPPELVLDVLEAAEARAKPPDRRRPGQSGVFRVKVDRYRAVQAKKVDGDTGDKLAPWADTLAGGDAARGRELFLNNSAVYCQRCHKLDNQGGDVGPPLNGIAAEPGKDRRYLLESVVLPSAQIAKGYETVVLQLADGRTVSGVLKSDTKKELRLMTADAKELVVPADDIESRRTGPSAMPDDLHKKLTRRELRDVVEFLAGLKEPLKKGGP
jgi:quinoprotein glucose dehydrogenase